MNGDCCMTKWGLAVASDIVIRHSTALKYINDSKRLWYIHRVNDFGSNNKFNLLDVIKAKRHCLERSCIQLNGVCIRLSAVQVLDIFPGRDDTCFEDLWLHIRT